MAADAECGYRFFVDAKHERFREVDSEQDLESDGGSQCGVKMMFSCGGTLPKNFGDTRN